MTALDTEDRQTEREREGIPTLTELAYMINSCPADQMEFDSADSAHYECVAKLSEEVEYRITAAIAAMRFYDESDEVVYSGMRADEIDYETSHPDAQSALKGIDTPEELIQFIADEGSQLGVRINADPEGFLIVMVQEQDDPYDRALETYAPIENVWRNGVQIYPQAGVAQPQP